MAYARANGSGFVFCWVEIWEGEDAGEVAGVGTEVENFWEVAIDILRMGSDQIVMATGAYGELCGMFTYKQALCQSRGNLISHIIDLSILLHILSSTLLLKILGVGVEDLQGRGIWRLTSIISGLSYGKWPYQRPRLQSSSTNCTFAENWPY